MLSLLVYLAVGAAVGWLGSQLARSTGWPALGRDVLAGAAGASVAGWLAPPLVGAPPLTQDAVSLDGVAVAVLGAMVVLALVHAARRHPVE